MKYTALLIALGANHETFTISREVETDDLSTIYTYMQGEAQVDDDEVDTILLFKNGTESPDVVGFWRAANGDFSGL